MNFADIIGWSMRLLAALPKVTTDIETTIKTVKSDTNLEQRVKSACEGLVQTVEDIASKM